MSLDHTDSVDAIGVERGSGHVILTIADSWDWSDETNHLLALQKKLNAYFAFIESGEICTAYPKAAGEQLVIEVIFRYPVSAAVQQFLSKAAIVAAKLMVRVRWKCIPSSLGSLEVKL